MWDGVLPLNLKIHSSSMNTLNNRVPQREGFSSVLFTGFAVAFGSGTPKIDGHPRGSITSIRENYLFSTDVVDPSGYPSTSSLVAI